MTQENPEIRNSIGFAIRRVFSKKLFAFFGANGVFATVFPTLIESGVSPELTAAALGVQAAINIGYFVVQGLIDLKKASKSDEPVDDVTAVLRRLNDQLTKFERENSHQAD